MLAGLSATVLGLTASHAGAAPGALDPTFGIGGLSSPPALPDLSYSAFGVGAQPDGKLVVASAEQYFSGPVRIVLQRSDINGNFDDSFGVGGIARYTPSVGLWQPFASAISPEGKTAVTGYRYIAPDDYDIFVLMFNADGSLDSSFDGDGSNTCGGDGVVCTAIDSTVDADQGRALAFQSSGKLIVAGSSQHTSGYTRMGVVRYTTTGAVDPTFAGGGKIQVQVGPWSSYANSVVVQPDGSIVLAGVTQGQGPNWNGTEIYADAIGLARLSSEGVLDASFHSVPPNYTGPAFTDGVMISPRPEWTYGAAYDAAVSPGGNIVVSGYANNVSPSPTASSILVARVTSSGALDPGFGNNGRAHVNIGTHQGGYSVRVDAAGRPLVAGFTNTDVDQPTLALRMTTSGGLDPGFNGTGYRIFSAESVGSDPGSTIAADGKWVLAGGRPDSRWGMLRMLMADDPASPPVITPAPPVATIGSPRSKLLKRKNFRQISGTAGPAGTVGSVEIALQRTDTRALKKKRRCYWVQSSKAKFKSVKATKGKCSKPYFRKASGTEKWKYSFTRILPKGSYALTVRVTLRDGQTALFTKKFRLK
jgi:uncharacterized delta-60 repeat protein